MALNKDISKDVDIYELFALAHVPEVNRILKYKIEEFKNGELRECIDTYNGRRSFFYDVLFTQQLNREKLEAPDTEYPPLYWFELTQYKPWDWAMTVINPAYPPYSPPYKILPLDVIEEMAHSLVNTQKILIKNSAYSKTLNKRVDVKYVRLSTNHMVGTVRDSERYVQVEVNPEQIKRKLESGKKENVKSKGRETLEMDPDTAYRIMLYYLEKFPEENIGFLMKYMEEMCGKMIDMDVNPTEPHGVTQ